MAQRSFRWLLLCLALLGVAADQASKYGVFRWLYDGSRASSRQVIPGAFELLTEFNPGGTQCNCALTALNGPVPPKVNQGALFGLSLTEWFGYGDGKRWLDNAFFAAVSLLAAAAIVFWATRPGVAHDPALCAALGLILGGTLGNLYDRVVFEGVRDFLHFYLIQWPVFNVADCCLVCGAFLLLLQAFVAHPAHHQAPTSEQAAPAPEPASATAK